MYTNKCLKGTVLAFRGPTYRLGSNWKFGFRNLNLAASNSMRLCSIRLRQCNSWLIWAIVRSKRCRTSRWGWSRKWVKDIDCEIDWEREYPMDTSSIEEAREPLDLLSPCTDGARLKSMAVGWSDRNGEPMACSGLTGRPKKDTLAAAAEEPRGSVSTEIFGSWK